MTVENYVASSTSLPVDDQVKLVLLGWFFRKGKGGGNDTWSFYTNLREYVRREIRGIPGGGILLKAYDLSTAKGREKEWNRIKFAIKDKAWRVIFGTKAKAAKDILKTIKSAKNVDAKYVIKRRIKANLRLEKRTSVNITSRIRLRTVVSTNFRKTHVSAKLYFLKPLPYKPVWKWVAVVDERLCPICGPCHNVTLPNTHPWWRTHIPPMHHNCRCTIKALSVRQGAKWAKEHRGKPIDRPPSVRAHKTFGTNGDDWKPNPKDYPPEMRDIIKKRLNRRKNQK